MRAVSIPARLPTGPLRSRRLLALASDDTLATQIQRGSEAAFEAVFERHAAGLLGFCRHMLGSPEEAEDAVQQTFASAFRDLQRGEVRRLALKPWLYAIARNRCLSMLRSRREHQPLAADLSTRGLADQVEQRAELRDLLRDLGSLPRDQRTALLLTQLGALSHAEAGQVLGCEAEKVKALVFRARSGLISRREARETPCTEIRRQLATLRGGSLRRSGLRHHLSECPGCRAYRRQVEEQRKLLAVALPVAPALGLKSSVLAAVGLGGGSAGGGLAAGLAGLGGALTSSLGTGTAAKLAAVGLAAGGGVAATTTLGGDPAPAPPPAVRASPSPSAAQPATAATGAGSPGRVRPTRRTARRRGQPRREPGRAPGTRPGRIAGPAGAQHRPAGSSHRSGRQPHPIEGRACARTAARPRRTGNHPAAPGAGPSRPRRRQLR